ncbi:WhiB family transcriptional regulator [Mycolicibacterium mengxianglii]|uniref:WhiB family transcriptional regulator n=1 Tax=Mycolicibacterium mengxianglii TaxID=2736649 RepID=UPI003558CABC
MIRDETTGGCPRLWNRIGSGNYTVAAGLIQTRIFFPDEHRGQALREREEQAKRICRACPVVTACRSHALQVPERFGVWGAMTARERARLLRSGLLERVRDTSSLIGSAVSRPHLS